MPVPPDAAMPEGLDASQSIPVDVEQTAVEQGEVDVQPRREVAFVDGNVEDAVRLSEELRSGAGEGRSLEVWLLDPSQDGIDQISQVLSGYTNLDAVHLVSHGSDGKLRLGNTWLESSNEESYAGQLATWTNSMREGADLLLYGCDLAATAQGRSFVEALSTATGMDAAASVDDTGHVSLGGDWDLEYRTGTIDAAFLGQTSPSNWQQLLAVTPISLPAPYQAGVDVQKNADVVMFPDGSFFGVAENSNDGSGEGIFGRFFDSSGAPTGSVLLINQTTLNEQVDPAVAVCGSGRIMVAWTSSQNGDRDIYARMFNSDGTPVAGEFLVNAGYTINDQQNVDVAVDPVGNYIVVWEGEGPGDTAGIFGQRFFWDGTPNGGIFQANVTTAGIQSNAAVASDADANFIVTWTDSAPADPVIRGQRFSSAGIAQGQFTVQATSVGAADLSSVAMDDAGNFVVVWGENNGDANNSGVRMRRFNAAGVALTGDVLVNTTTSNNQFDPAVSMDGDGDFVVSWTSENQDGSNNGVVLRAYNSDGTPGSGEMLVNTYSPSDQHVSQISLNDFGQFVVVWEGASAGDAEAVYGRVYTWVEAATISSTPLAIDDAYSLNEDGALVVPVAGVLTNDSDADSDPLTALLVSGTSNGGLVFNADGSFTYTPNSNFNGTDSFTYRAFDGLGTSNLATVTITVNSVNDAPVAFNNSYSTLLSLPLNVGASRRAEQRQRSRGRSDHRRARHRGIGWHRRAQRRRFVHVYAPLVVPRAG